MCNAFSIELERIEECGEERADWKIDTGKFIILIEQKSTIIRQSVKQQLTDFKAYKETVFKTIVKAMSQLKTTEQAYGIDHAFKFVLCYDDYFDDNLMQYVFDDDKCSIENDGRYFLINITEMEMMMDLSKKDEDLFEEVLKELEDRSLNHSEKGVSVLKVMQDKGFSTHSYWVSPVFEKYKSILENVKVKHDKFIK